ncbi:MAG: histidine phosphatase family protein [Saprospiraceae bacterium]
MKTIFISRHAKSSWDNYFVQDFDRPLNVRGLNDAPMMAAKLKAHQYFPQYIISSPAKRALSTAEFYAKEFNLPITEDKNLYHGDEGNYLEVINQTDEKYNSVMLFGHNPGITYIANSIQSGCTDNIPTSGLIIASCDVKTWKEVDWHLCHLIQLAYPKLETF